jgi:hypothetical protein
VSEDRVAHFGVNRDAMVSTRFDPFMRDSPTSFLYFYYIDYDFKI